MRAREAPERGTVRDRSGTVEAEAPRQALDALLDGSLAMWEVRNLPLPTGERTVGEDVQGATVGRYDGRNCWSLWIVFFTPNFFQTTPLQTLVC